MLQGFGTFIPWLQKERIGRNPRTGIACAIPARTSVKFKPGKFCFQICGKIGTLAGHIGKGEIAYEEVLVLAGKMTVVEFCGG